MSAGLVLIDKPQGWTSHDVVAKLRRILGTRKVGHAGTLDPMATGLLVCGFGQATKLLTYIVGSGKTYEATIQLGATTDTEDATGTVTTTVDLADRVDEIEAALPSALKKLTGRIDQVPSSVSAIKVDGKRAYARVRDGEEVKLAARPIEIYEFSIESATPVSINEADDVVTNIEIKTRVRCSSGTYIRALARDLGAELGVGGHLTALRRTQVGSFDIGRAQKFDPVPIEVTTLSLTESCETLFPVVSLSQEQAEDISFGRSVARELFTGPQSTLALIAPDGKVAAIARAKSDRLAPEIVFTPAP